MTQPQARPEDRSRSGADSLREQPWADTHPGCFRSEGFAEDLPEAAPQPALAASPGRAWNLLRQGADMLLLNVALVGGRGALGR